jgi:hypothetical protein
VLATTISITEKTTGEKVCNALRKLAANDGSPIVAQIMAQERELAIIEADIIRQEGEMNSLVYSLYNLNDDEIRLVEQGYDTLPGTRRQASASGARLQGWRTSLIRSDGSSGGDAGGSRRRHGVAGSDAATPWVRCGMVARKQYRQSSSGSRACLQKVRTIAWSSMDSTLDFGMKEAGSGCHFATVF